MCKRIFVVCLLFMINKAYFSHYQPTQVLLIIRGLVLACNVSSMLEMIILSLFFFFFFYHCHSYIAVHFLEMFLLLVENTSFSTAQNFQELAHAVACVARIKCLKALTSIMGFTVMPVYSISVHSSSVTELGLLKKKN